ncbi:MAG: AAA family ATPase [Deltaproteobacteria bacterium]|nr:AAA family ATPase [Deltaproteobacteria bacterium]
MNYLEFFHLQEDPFGLTPDLNYFYPSKMHNEILSSLDYAVEQKEGFSLVIGDPGTGKTTVLKIFMDRWKDRAEIALIMTPRLSSEELLQAVLDDLNIHIDTANKNEMIKLFRDFLINRSLSGKRVIIIVDEAQNLSDGCLEELRLLSNLETDKEKLLQIILVGQPELQKRLHSEGLRQLDQRITVRATMRPLNQVETSDYITFRLIKAGRGSAVFEEKAKKLIYTISGGIPRLINLTTSRALMVAYLGTSHRIEKKHVLDAAKHIPESQPGTVPRRITMRYGATTLLILAVIFLSLISYHALQTDTNPPPTPNIAKVQDSSTATTTQPAQPAPPAKKAVTDPVKSHAAVKPEVPEKREKKATVIVRLARLREGPSFNADIVTKVSRGASFPVVDEWTTQSGNKWYRIKAPDGNEYWIASYIVRIVSPDQLP